jgi:hypothetical protein
MEAPGPKPVAAVRGTTIIVEDLFYNMPTRRKVGLLLRRRRLLGCWGCCCCWGGRGAEAGRWHWLPGRALGYEPTAPPPVAPRPQALRPAPEEYAAVLDVVAKYAVYKAGVAFTCKRQASAPGWRR